MGSAARGTFLRSAENRCGAGIGNSSGFPRDQEVSDLLKPGRAPSVGFKNLASLAHQPGGDLLRFLDSMQGRVRRLLLRAVFPHRFAEGLAGAEHVKQVIRNLKSQADLFTVTGYPREVGFRCLRRKRAATD